MAYFFGTQTGNTQTEAEIIQQAFGGESIVELIDVSKADVELIDVSKAEASDFERFENIIIGCPTWNVGELQSGWEAFYDELDNVDFSGKKVTYFGPGDQVGYPETFEDAMGMLEAKITEQGGTTVGYWPKEGYEFSESQALREDQFVGLALDEDNQSELTEERIQTWVAQLKQEFSL